MAAAIAGRAAMRRGPVRRSRPSPRSAAPGRRRGNRTPPGWDRRPAGSDRLRRPAPAPAGPPADRDAGRRRPAAAGPWPARRPAVRRRWPAPPGPRRPVRRRPGRARWPAVRRCRPRRAAASPARTAGRSVPRRPTPGARDNRPMRCSCGGSTPRSAQRASRSRSSVAKPAVPSAGRSAAGHRDSEPSPSSRSPASSSRMMPSCSAPVTSRGGGSPARAAAWRSTANA